MIVLSFFSKRSDVSQRICNAQSQLQQNCKDLTRTASARLFPADALLRHPPWHQTIPHTHIAHPSTPPAFSTRWIQRLDIHRASSVGTPCDELGTGRITMVSSYTLHSTRALLKYA